MTGSNPGYPHVRRVRCTDGGGRPSNLNRGRRSSGSVAGALRSAPFADLVTVLYLFPRQSFMDETVTEREADDGKGYFISWIWCKASLCA